MQTVITINAVIMALFFVCYSYQFFYVAVALLKRKKFTCRNENHRIAVLIAARNEENVIGQLLDSIHAQKNYPMDHVDIYVGADNCTDDTARVARERGAIVFERHDTVHVGKGYVLNEMLKRIKRPGRKHYDAYLVLDADNILDPNFISEIEKVYSSGYEIVTCYRNSKNYGDNWISAGYALWFLREAQYLNNARMRLGSSCAVSGTGFLFSDGVLEACGGWNFFLLTEDIEFTIDNVVRGEKVGSELFSGIARGSFSCYDMTMNIMPAAVLTGVSVVVNIGAAIANATSGGSMAVLAVSVLQTLMSLYLTLFVLGAITTVTEWKNIRCAAWKKVLYAFTFPLFMLTYVPICIVSLFTKVEWKPICHTRVMTLEQIEEPGLRAS